MKEEKRQPLSRVSAFVSLRHANVPVSGVSKEEDSADSTDKTLLCFEEQGEC